MQQPNYFIFNQTLLILKDKQCKYLMHFVCLKVKQFLNNPLPKISQMLANQKDYFLPSFQFGGMSCAKA